MQTIKEIGYLLQKEILLEWRKSYALSGILLYVLSTVFVIYISFINIQPQVWNVLFWIIILFASVNAVAKSFVQEGGTRQLYYYTLANPIAIIISKIIYNSLLLLLLSALTFFTFSIVAGNPVKEGGMFALAIFLGSFGFSITLTFISAIATKTDNSATLTAILGFPVILPVLLVLIKLSANALRLIQDTAVGNEIMLLAGVDMLLLAMCFLLFPYLWRD